MKKNSRSRSRGVILVRPGKAMPGTAALAKGFEIGTEEALQFIE